MSEKRKSEEKKERRGSKLVGRRSFLKIEDEEVSLGPISDSDP